MPCARVETCPLQLACAFPPGVICTKAPHTKKFQSPLCSSIPDGKERGLLLSKCGVSETTWAEIPNLESPLILSVSSPFSYTTW